MTHYDQTRALLRADEPAVLRAVADYIAESYTPEQEARQEGEVYQLVRYGRGSAESPYLLDQRDDGYWTPWHVAQRELARALAANPSACELGAVREAAELARELLEAGMLTHNGTSRITVHATRAKAVLTRLTEALQHRGDSRGGEG